MYHLDELARIRRNLVEKKETLTEELNALPEGVLFCTENEGYKKYYRRLPAVGNRKKERRYGIKSNVKLMNKMVRKSYVEKTLPIIDRNIEVLDYAIKNYLPVDEQSVMEPLLTRFPEISDGIYREPINSQEWKDYFDRIEDYHSESLRQTAADGTKMRSKNEVYISSRLDYYGLTYRSDCPTGIPNLYRVPDFTVLRKKDNQPIYWEHMGMMDNYEYRIDNKRKIEEYEAVGIVPWKNLIITYDTVEGGLRADIIEMMIKAWLI